LRDRERYDFEKGKEREKESLSFLIIIIIIILPPNFTYNGAFTLDVKSLLYEKSRWVSS
jgi:hypothetical protein